MKTWMLAFTAVAPLVLPGCDANEGTSTRLGLCSAGYQWDQTTCSCVPSTPACTQDSDCRLLTNTCDVCSCSSLPTGTNLPACTGTTVTCSADPCQGKLAACVTGTCRVN